MGLNQENNSGSKALLEFDLTSFRLCSEPLLQSLNFNDVIKSCVIFQANACQKSMIPQTYIIRMYIPFREQTSRMIIHNTY